MAGQTKTASHNAKWLRSLLIGILLGLAVLFAFGAIGSLLIAKGVVALERMNGIVLAALFCGGMVSGTVTARRGNRLPLLWSVGTAAMLVAFCTLCGAAFYGEIAPDVLVKHIVSALLGGVCGGILAAL